MNCVIARPDYRINALNEIRAEEPDRERYDRDVARVDKNWRQQEQQPHAKEGDYGQLGVHLERPRLKRS